MCWDKPKVMGTMSLLTVFLVMIIIIIIQASTGGSDTTAISTEINNPAPQGGDRELKGKMGLAGLRGHGGLEIQGGTQINNIVDKKWFENLLKLKIERLVNVDIHANSTTILIVSLGFSFCILLICGGLCAYATYNCKWRKPAKKQKWNEMVKKITELEKAMTAPMAPMATRDYMAAMQHAAMHQSFCVDEWLRAEFMDLVQLATGLTVLTAGLMVLCLLVAGLCACTFSRRKTVKHCETSQVEFEANAKHGLQPVQPILRHTVHRELNPSNTFPRPSNTFLRPSDTFLRPTDNFPRPFDTFPRPNPIGVIVEAPQFYPILEKITLSQQPANAYVESKPRTRFDSSCKLSSFVGTGKEFAPADVPTVRAVIRRGLLMKEIKCHGGVDVKNYPVKEIARDLAPLVMKQWLKANVLFVTPVIVTERQIVAKIELAWNKAYNVAQGRGKKIDREKVVGKLDRLFDIVSCQHPILLCAESGSGCAGPSSCNEVVHILCSCKREEKVPRLELQWLMSQRKKIGEKGGMQMAAADLPFSKKQNKIAENKAKLEEAVKRRKAKEERVAEDLLEREEQEIKEQEMEDLELDEAADPMELGDTILPPLPSQQEVKEAREIVSALLEEKLGDQAHLVTRYLDSHRLRKNHMPVPNTAAESMRFDVSPAAGAAVATGYLKDLIAAGHLSKDLSYLTLDPNKLRRARQSVMTRAQKEDLEKARKERITAIYFDGRKDKTRAMLPDLCGRLHPKIVKEEHVSVTQEPEGSYLGHFTPEPAVYPDKPAKMVAVGLYDMLLKCDSTDTVDTLGGDSYNGNTGWKGGTNAHLEKMLCHKCHWAVCMCHTNELPLRHLIDKLDGKTSSKDGFTGPVGKLLSNVPDMEMNYDFEPLPGGEDLIVLPPNIVNGLCTDACTSYKYCAAVKTGILSPEVAGLKPGKIVHSRWLTTGESLLMMWTRKHGLTGRDLEILKTLVLFCLRSYFKLYFEIKVKHYLVHGPYHILTQLRILKSLPMEVRDIVTPYIRTGAWYAHSECVLLSLLGSDVAEDRSFAIQWIFKIRGGKELGDLSLRDRVTPRLNLEATSLQTLISWKLEELHEPVYTCKLTKEELNQYLEKPYPVPKYSIHTQATERCVKQVTEAAAAVVGQERRDGFVRARVHSRQQMPMFKTKKDMLATFL